jgi:hypothetical protein
MRVVQLTRGETVSLDDAGDEQALTIPRNRLESQNGGRLRGSHLLSER